MFDRNSPRLSLSLSGIHTPYHTNALIFEPSYVVVATQNCVREKEREIERVRERERERESGRLGNSKSLLNE